MFIPLEEIHLARTYIKLLKNSLNIAKKVQYYKKLTVSMPASHRFQNYSNRCQEP